MTDPFAINRVNFGIPQAPAAPPQAFTGARLISHPSNRNAEEAFLSPSMDRSLGMDNGLGAGRYPLMPSYGTGDKYTPTRPMPLGGYTGANRLTTDLRPGIDNMGSVSRASAEMGRRYAAPLMPSYQPPTQAPNPAEWDRRNKAAGAINGATFLSPDARTLSSGRPMADVGGGLAADGKPVVVTDSSGTHARYELRPEYVQANQEAAQAQGQIRSGGARDLNDYKNQQLAPTLINDANQRANQDANSRAGYLDNMGQAAVTNAGANKNVVSDLQRQLKEHQAEIAKRQKAVDDVNKQLQGFQRRTAQDKEHDINTGVQIGSRVTKSKRSADDEPPPADQPGGVPQQAAPPQQQAPRSTAQAPAPTAPQGAASMGLSGPAAGGSMRSPAPAPQVASAGEYDHPTLGRITQADLESTARKHGISIEDVMNELGIKNPIQVQR